VARPRYRPGHVASLCTGVQQVISFKRRHRLDWSIAVQMVTFNAADRRSIRLRTERADAVSDGNGKRDRSGATRPNRRTCRCCVTREGPGTPAPQGPGPRAESSSLGPGSASTVPPRQLNSRQSQPSKPRPAKPGPTTTKCGNMAAGTGISPLHVRARFPQRYPSKKGGPHSGCDQLMSLPLPEIRHLLIRIVWHRESDPRHVIRASVSRGKHQRRSQQ